MGGKKAKGGIAKTKGTSMKKKQKKKVMDVFLKKEWYEVRAPAVFPVRHIGQTIVTKTIGNKLASDNLKGRVFDISQGDLAKDAELDSYRMFRLKVDDVQGKVCLTSFYGMRLTTDKLRSIVKKWHTLIEAFTDIKTAEGYVLRVFAIAFTKKQPGQVKTTCYAQSSQIRRIRKRIIEILEREISGNDLNSLITRLMTQSIGKEIEKQCDSIFPLQNAYVRKIKVLRTPKFDGGRLMEMHGGANVVAQMAADAGVPVQDVEEEQDQPEQEEE